MSDIPRTDGAQCSQGFEPDGTAALRGADADTVVSRARIRLGTWVVPILVLGPLGLVVIWTAIGAGRGGVGFVGAILWWLGLMLAVPLVGVLRGLRRVEADAAGLRVLSRHALSWRWSEIEALSFADNVSPERRTMTLVPSQDVIRAQVQQGRPWWRIKTAATLAIEASAASAIEGLWKQHRPQGVAASADVDSYAKTTPFALMPVFWVLYFLVMMTRGAGISVFAVTVGILVLLVVTVLGRDRMMMHVVADHGGIALRGRLGYRLAWEDVSQMVVVPMPPRGRSIIQLTLTPDARRRIGTRRLLDGFGANVVWSVGLGQGDALKRLREGATPTSGAR